jgi:hypothetical protein
MSDNIQNLLGWMFFLLSFLMMGLGVSDLIDPVISVAGSLIFAWISAILGLIR